MKTTAEKIAVMQAFEEGRIIESKRLTIANDAWVENEEPNWSWNSHDYRVAAEKPDSIDWDAVHPRYKWMARDMNERAMLFMIRPDKYAGFWSMMSNDIPEGEAYHCVIPASAFESYKAGGMPWGKSLVERPTNEGGE